MFETHLRICVSCSDGEHKCAFKWCICPKCENIKVPMALIIARNKESAHRFGMLWRLVGTFSFPASFPSVLLMLRAGMPVAEAILPAAAAGSFFALHFLARTES